MPSMDVKWPKMIVIRPGASYAAGERLYWPEYHLSLRVPPTCACDAGQIYAFFRSSEGGLEALLNVHKPSDVLVSGWLDEAFTAGSERLEPITPTETRLGVKSRQLASASAAGYKMTVGDPFRYQASVRLTGPADRDGDLSLLLRQIVGSIRFVHQDALNEEQHRQAAGASGGNRPRSHSEKNQALVGCAPTGATIRRSRHVGRLNRRPCATSRMATLVGLSLVRSTAAGLSGVRRIYRRAGSGLPALHDHPPRHVQADRVGARSALGGQPRDVICPAIR